MLDLHVPYMRIVSLYPDQKEREEILLKNGLTCFSSYVSKKCAYSLKALRYLQKKKNSAIIECMCEVRNLCVKAGIPYAFLKGLCLAAQLYAPLEMRIFEDIDILINKDDYTQLVQACLDAGFYYEQKDAYEVVNPYQSIQNGHLHAECLYKAFCTPFGSITIPLEIHVSPIEGCFELYGHVLPDEGYSKCVLYNTRQIRIVISDKHEEVFEVPSIEDDIYIQLLHLVTHLTIDPVLYLYVNKPWQNQLITKMMLDLYLLSEKELPDWVHISKMASDQKRLEEINCAINILNQFWGTNYPTDKYEINRNEYNRPIDFVCRILNQVDIRYVVGGGEKLKKEVDRLACNWIQEQNQSIPAGFYISKEDRGLSVTIDKEHIPYGDYTLSVYQMESDHEWRIQDYLLIISDAKWELFENNGFQRIWDPKTYGTNKETDVQKCYSKLILRKSLSESVYIEILFSETNPLCLKYNYHISIIRCTSPFLSRFVD